MQDVYDTVYRDDIKIADQKTAALTPEQAKERFDAEEYIARVRLESKARHRKLPRPARRRAIYADILEAKRRAGVK